MCRYCENPLLLATKEERESDIECDLAYAQRRKREDDKLRSEGKPTLKTTIGYLLDSKKKK